MTNVLDAAYWTGRDYPGGIEALGRRVGRPHLSDELNPTRPPNLWLQTAVDMQLMSKDYRILYAMAQALGHFPPVPMPEQVDSAMPCHTQVGQLTQEFADVMSEVMEGLKDGRITDTELRRATRQWQELVQAGQVLMQQLTALNAALRAQAPTAQGGAA
jgi:hypothetical protein